MWEERLKEQMATLKVEQKLESNAKQSASSKANDVERQNKSRIRDGGGEA